MSDPKANVPDQAGEQNENQEEAPKHVKKLSVKTDHKAGGAAAKCGTPECATPKCATPECATPTCATPTCGNEPPKK